MSRLVTNKALFERMMREQAMYERYKKNIADSKRQAKTRAERIAMRKPLLEKRIARRRAQLDRLAVKYTWAKKNRRRAETRLMQKEIEARNLIEASEKDWRAFWVRFRHEYSAMNLLL